MKYLDLKRGFIIICGVYALCAKEGQNALSAQMMTPTPTVSHAQREAIQTTTRQAIRTAEQYVHNGQYSEAFRLLYDAYTQEDAAHMPSDAYSKMYDIELSLIHRDQSVLMRYLRNPQVSIYDRKAVLETLNALAEPSDENSKRALLVREQYPGPFLEIAMSPQLSADEKAEILRLVEITIGEEYVSEEERNRLIQQAEQDEAESNMHFKRGEYPEAYRLLDKATVIYEQVLYTGSSHTTSNSWRFYDDYFTYTFQSPILTRLRSSSVSFEEKQSLLAKLENFIQYPESQNASTLFQVFPNDPLLQLLADPEFSVDAKLGIVHNVKEAVEKGMYKGIYD